MKWIIIILVVLAVVLVAALILSAMKRKKDQVGRERASELRSEAADTAATKREQEARAREAEAEAERVRAQADKLEAQAEEKRTSYDMTQARQEDAVREADRVDPDVNHRSKEYAPDLNGSPAQRSPEHGSEHGHDHDHGHDHPSGLEPEPETSRVSSQRQAGGPANPVPTGPETIVPDDYDESRRDQI